MHKLRWISQCLIFILTCSMAEAATVEALRLWPAPDGTRLVFDLTEPVVHRLFTLPDPYRVVIDIDDSRAEVDFQSIKFGETVIKNLRYGHPKKNVLRVVLDLNEPVVPKSFQLRPNDQYKDRLVIDLNKKSKEQEFKVIPVRTVLSMKERDFVIVVDPGHGGEDPGAVGQNGTYEKEVVLSIGRLLTREMNKKEGIKSVMIRDGDYYIGLRQRIAKARRHQADLFVSIHADAFKNGRAEGASVYTLSPHGASNEASRWLAERENSADLIGGISLDDKDDMLASVLLDLSQTASGEASFSVAELVLRNLKGITKLHSHRVQKAGFAVLKSPDIPSILVETGFISNLKEERRLKSKKYQMKLASAIASGLHGYLEGKPRPRLQMTMPSEPLQIKVKRGDTLSRLAKEYETSVSMLKDLNALKSDVLYVGQALKIPPKNG